MLVDGRSRGSKVETMITWALSYTKVLHLSMHKSRFTTASLHTISSLNIYYVYTAMSSDLATTIVVNITVYILLGK